MSADSLTDDERRGLRAVGRERTVDALLDLDQRHLSEFVPASRLFDVATGNEIQHPALDATDAEVRSAVEGGLADD